jgi:hypothetical protein
MFKRVVCVASLVTVLAVAASLRAADDPLIGTWKLNLAKSKYTGMDAPKSQVYKYEANGPDGVKFTNDTVEADGTKIHAEYAVKFDGKPVPIKGDPTRDMATNKRVDANTTSGENSLKGKPSGVFTRSVSKDGKTLTINAKSTRAGKPTEQTAVYDRQ